MQEKVKEKFEQKMRDDMVEKLRVNLDLFDKQKKKYALPKGYTMKPPACDHFF